MSTSIKLDKTDITAINEVLAGFSDEEVVNIFSSRMDAIERLIYEGGLRIKAIHFHKDLGIMLIVLNNKKTLKRNLTDFALLQDADEAVLGNYELVGKGVGAYWPDLDEDLSLKSFLIHEMKRAIQDDSKVA